ncbi:MAG TPA: hypothetical protein VE127_17635 [Solirubrobacteraceae bacterium]|nr:hypothetical protein [Solirubrobacteraceae bacterium]
MPVETPAPVARPPQMSANPVRRVADDIVAEWRGRGKFPPGPNDFSLARTHKIAHDPLPVLLGAYDGSPPERIERFRAILAEHGLAATVRLTRGRDIEAACGQLAAAG